MGPCGKELQLFVYTECVRPVVLVEDDDRAVGGVEVAASCRAQEHARCGPRLIHDLFDLLCRVKVLPGSSFAPQPLPDHTPTCFLDVLLKTFFQRGCVQPKVGFGRT